MYQEQYSGTEEIRNSDVKGLLKESWIVLDMHFCNESALFAYFN